MIARNEMDRIFLDLGHDDFTRGTGYLRQAALIYAPGMALTKELYPALAKANDTTPERVERCMRHSIEKAWLRGDQDTRLKYFGYSVDPDSGRPRVGEYVARLARIFHEGLEL